MRCPKCHYLSFEPEPRCKNCGYDFSFSTKELTIELDDTEEPETALGEVVLQRESTDAPTPITLGPMHRDDDYRNTPTDLDPILKAGSSDQSDEDLQGRELTPATPLPPPPAPPPVARATPTPPAPAVAKPTRKESPRATRAAVPAPPPASASPTSDLPLFVQGLKRVGDSTTPMPTPPAPPKPPTSAAPVIEPEPPKPVRRARADAEDVDVKVPPAPPPLSVRRRAPEPPKVTPKPPIEERAPGPVDRDLLEDLQKIEQGRTLRAMPPMNHPADETDEGLQPVPAGKRLTAALIDVALLGGLNAGVVWFTLRVCDLPFARASILPLAPLIAFLLLVDTGYLLMFTAAIGQTIGKMATGIKVVATTEYPISPEKITLGQAALRALCCIPLAGFLPALIGERLAVHDRIAHTRVVRA